MVGTLAYMSPEQAEGRAAGPEADVYSLALMLYECWSGENPAPPRDPGGDRARDRRPRRARCAASAPTCRASSATRSTPACRPRPARRPSLEELGERSRSSLDGLADASPRAERSLGLRLGAVAARRDARGLARRRSRRAAAVGFQPVFPPPRSWRLAREKEPPISVLRNLESRIEGLVEGVFSRAFSSEVQPVELARKLAKEMDAHKTAGVARVYVPNEYTVFLSSKDRVKLEGYERSLEQELSGYLLEHARRRNYDLLTRPAVEFKTDERLRLGEFGIQTRLVKPPGPRGRGAAARARRATRWSTRRSRASRQPAEAPSSGRKRWSSTRAVVSLDDRRYVLDGPRATIGRSKQAECVLADPNVSRRHAELRRSQTRRLDDRRPRLDQRRQGQRPARLLDPAQSRRPGHGRHHDLPLRHRAVAALA